MSTREDALRIAKAFHARYERLAPEFGYRTREESAKHWDDIPAENKRLMVQTVEDLLCNGTIAVGEDPTSRADDRG